MKAIIDLKQILKNAKSIEEKSKKNLICVIKSNAYNLGALKVASYLYEHGYLYFAVVCIKEANNLVDGGFKGQLIILNSIDENDLDFVNQNDTIIPSINSIDDAKIFSRYSFTRKIKVHLQIDTGMNRLGFCDIQECKEAINLLLNNSNIIIDGVYTHYTSLDNKKNQEDIFKKYLSLYDFKMIHASATPTYSHASIENYVRVGMDLYGDNEENQSVSVYEKVASIRKVVKGATVGYNEDYLCLIDTYVALLTVGYNEGIIRGMQGNTLYLEGKMYPIIGRVCMNHLFINVNGYNDIDNIKSKYFEITSKNNTLKKHAKYLNTISYEVLLLMNFTDREYLE